MCNRRGTWESHPLASTSGVLGLHTCKTMPTVYGAVSSPQLSHSHIKGRTSHCRWGWPWTNGCLAISSPSEFWEDECSPKLSNWQRKIIYWLIFWREVTTMGSAYILVILETKYLTFFPTLIFLSLHLCQYLFLFILCVCVCLGGGAFFLPPAVLELM